MGFAANSHGSAMSPDQEPQRAPTSSTSPHPRHRSHSLHYDSWYHAGTQQHHDYEYHLVDNDFDPAPHHHNPASDDDHGSEAQHASASTSSDRLPTGDREPRPQALRPIRYRRSGLVRRDRLARIELSTRRRQPDGMSGPQPAGPTPARGPLPSPRSRLDDVMDGPGREPRSSSTALCVLGIVTLATLTLILWEVL